MTIRTLTVNDQVIIKEVDDNTLLIEFLREHLNLTGTHMGCDTSQCGCCVVHVNGQAVKSCTMFVGQAEGTSITTVEGLAKNGELHPIQKAFTECHALQCGFCTPGMMMSAVDLINQYPGPLTADIVRREMEGNLCRCTGYHNIVKAILAASEVMRPGSTVQHPGD